MIKEDGIEKVGPSLYLPREGQLPLLMFTHEALNVEKGHFLSEQGGVGESHRVLVVDQIYHLPTFCLKQPELGQQTYLNQEFSGTCFHHWQFTHQWSTSITYSVSRMLSLKKCQKSQGLRHFPQHSVYARRTKGYILERYVFLVDFKAKKLLPKHMNSAWPSNHSQSITAD